MDHRKAYAVTRKSWVISRTKTNRKNIRGMVTGPGLTQALVIGKQHEEKSYKLFARKSSLFMLTGF